MSTTTTPDKLDSIISAKVEDRTLPLSKGELVDVFKSSFIIDTPTETVVKKEVESDVIRSEEVNPIYNLPKGNRGNILVSEEAIRISRAIYLRDIVNSLNWISENHEPGTPIAANEFAKVFSLINDYTSKASKDPFSSALLSLYQGLIFEDHWISTHPKVLYEVGKLLKSYANRSKLDYDDIDKILIKLCDLGINPTPF